MKSIKNFCKKLHLCLSGFWIRIWKCLVLTLFFPKFPFVPPKNIKKPLIYWYFQGDQQGTLGIKSLTETFWKKKLQTLCMQLYFKRPLLKVLSSKFCASTKTSSESLKQTPDVTRDCLSILFHSPIMISTTQI